ncbi:MAG: crossover junction endodeoxyribonuclease RuvC [Kiritimatiellae bacterium]|nr:crossover junction endodeoxyribonuclease RuvC [Kiritimatiellia bacterium]
MPPLRILGIDAALRTSGICVLEADGSRLQPLYFGLVANPPSRSHSDALFHLRREIDALITHWHPAEAAIEGVFYCRNARTALALGEARGTILCLMAERGIPVFEYPPATVKSSVAGRGMADKAAVQRMVRALLNIEVPIAEDASDALAVALCHAHSGLARKLGSTRPM